MTSIKTQKLLKAANKAGTKSCSFALRDPDFLLMYWPGAEVGQIMIRWQHELLEAGGIDVKLGVQTLSNLQALYANDQVFISQVFTEFVS